MSMTSSKGSGEPEARLRAFWSAFMRLSRFRLASFIRAIFRKVAQPTERLKEKQWPDPASLVRSLLPGLVAIRSGSTESGSAPSGGALLPPFRSTELLELKIYADHFCLL
jgi:hypothetical protein